MEVNHNDILLNITGASIGRVTLSPKSARRKGKSARVHYPAYPGAGTEISASILSSPEMQQIMDLKLWGYSSSTDKTTDSRFEIPIPPIAEQIRIADKLDSLLSRVDACRERLDRVPAILKRFRQAVLAAATSGELTKGWEEMAGNPESLSVLTLTMRESFRDYNFHHHGQFAD